MSNSVPPEETAAAPYAGAVPPPHASTDEMPAATPAPAEIVATASTEPPQAPIVAPASPSAEPSTTNPAAFAGRLLALFVAVVALCVLGYLAFAVPGKWFTGVRSVAWGPKDM